MYFVEKFREDNWEEEELINKVARHLDRQERKERVVSGNRKFWAGELLLDSLWKRVKLRKDTKRWSKEILLDRWRKVMIVDWFSKSDDRQVREGKEIESKQKVERRTNKRRRKEKKVARELVTKVVKRARQKRVG